MFIISKKNFKVRRTDGTVYAIRKDYAGEIPEDVAAHWLVQAAIQSGSIAAAAGTRDRDLQNADQEAGEKANAADIRPDAKEDPAEDEKAAGKRNSKK